MSGLVLPVSGDPLKPALKISGENRRRFYETTNPPCGGPFSLGVWNFFIGWLREALAVAFFNAAHGAEQMVIRACAKLLMLAVEDLHHERIKNADLLQCFHVAVNAGECCVEAVKEIVDLGFGYDSRVRCADRICVSHELPFLGS